MPASGTRRRVGQTADPSIKPLLKTLYGKSRPPSRPKSPEDINAPPIDSDDDPGDSETLSESGEAARSAPRGADNNSDGGRGDITKTTFGANLKTTSTSRAEKLSLREDEQRPLRGKPVKNASSDYLHKENQDVSDSEDEIASSQEQPVTRLPRKRGLVVMTSEPEEGNMESHQARFNLSRKRQQTYGSKRIMARNVKRPSRGLIVPKDVPPSPERAPRQIKKPRPLSPGPERKVARLRVPSLSPAPERTVSIKAAAYFEDSPPSRLKSPGGTKIAITPGSDFGWPSAGDHDNNDELAGSPVPSSSLPKVDETCPMCYQPIDRDLLHKFSNGKPLTMRQQMKFCNIHKARSAEDTWRQRGYPSIDWSVMGKRLKRHHKLLGRIINGEDSHYRADLADKLVTGEERTLRKTERSLAPGYYGNRGLRLMSEHIIQHFSESLRERAVDDRVISGRGTTVFVSKVLVPELATRLIMEDMSVGLSEARDILLESVDMGDLLHDDVADGEIDDVDTMDNSFGSVDDGF